MASSGYTSVTVTAYDTLKFSWWIASQSIPNNESTVSWKLELISTAYGEIVSSAPKKWSVTVNGTPYSGENKIGIGNNSTKTLASGSTVIEHDDDGTKTFSYSFSQEIIIYFNNVYIGTKNGSGTGTLDTIARASQPSCITWPENTTDVGYFGDSIAIHMNRKSSTFTHEVWCEYGNVNYTIASSSARIGTGTTWTIPLSFMDKIPKNRTGSGWIYARTYDASGNVIGENRCPFTAKVPDQDCPDQNRYKAMLPVPDATFSDVTGLNATYGGYVKGLSKLKIIASATQAYSSPISSYKITANGTTYNSSPATTDALADSGSLQITIQATDARGNTGKIVKTISVLDYLAPRISSLSVHRCNASGNEDDQGKQVKVTFSASAHQFSNNANIARYTVSYKKTNNANYTDVALTALNNNFAVSGSTYMFTADESSAYDVKITVADNHHSASRETSVSTAFSLMDWYDDGTGLRFGGVATKSNTMQVSLNAEFDKDVVMSGNSYAFYSSGDGQISGYTCMAKIVFNQSTYFDSPITFTFRRRLATLPMTVHVAYSSTADIDPDLSSINYEGSNYGAFLVRTAASTWEFYVQQASALDTISLQEWHTSPTIAKYITVSFPGNTVASLPSGLNNEGFYRATPAVPRSILDCFMPVGYVLILHDNHTSEKMNPNVMYSGTTWVRIENRFLWASDAAGTIGLTGGEKEHVLTVNELPSHNHKEKYYWSRSSSGTVVAYPGAIESSDPVQYQSSTSTENTGGGAAHNNMPPYVQVSVWRRTA